MSYLLVHVGCLECGDPTVIETVAVPPSGITVITPPNPGEERELQLPYNDSTFAVELP